MSDSIFQYGIFLGKSCIEDSILIIVISMLLTGDKCNAEKVFTLVFLQEVYFCHIWSDW